LKLPDDRLIVKTVKSNSHAVTNNGYSVTFDGNLFRQDLWSRIAVFLIKLPLGDRAADISARSLGAAGGQAAGDGAPRAVAG
jgi:hypothetical protein